MPFEYYSTRSSREPVSFEHAVIEGLAPDGGLYLPEVASQPPSNFLDAWRHLSFEDLAMEIFTLYISEQEIPRDDLRELVCRSYSTFRNPEVSPLHELNAEKKLSVLELWHGPTYAFKDVALQFVGNLFEYFLVRRNQGKAADADRAKLTVIGATSGDTGSAAIYGLRGKKDVSVFILYPTGRVSPIQEQQMTTVLDENVHTISVPGTFDDCQDLVKQMFGDREFNAKHRVGAVNSINWARILSQITYYFKSYFALKGVAPGDRVRYVVPSGNFGDILAGFYAREMGLPIDLVVATNANDILYRFLASGEYAKGSEVVATLSPAMDILVSSNFERFLWVATRKTVAHGNNIEAGNLVSQWMDELRTNGRFSVPQEVLAEARATFTAQHTSDAETTAAIRTTFRELQPGYIVDPHTAVGIHAALQEIATVPDATYVVLSTAHPAKFSEAVGEALGKEPGFDFENQVLPASFKTMMKAESKKIMAKSTTKAEIQRIVEETL